MNTRKIIENMNAMNLAVATSLDLHMETLKKISETNTNPTVDGIIIEHTLKLQELLDGLNSLTPSNFN